MPEPVAEGQERSASTKSARAPAEGAEKSSGSPPLPRAPAPVNASAKQSLEVPVSVTVSRIEESVGENADGAIKGLVARIQHLEEVLLGELQTGSLADRAAVLQSNC